MAEKNQDRFTITIGPLDQDQKTMAKTMQPRRVLKKTPISDSVVQASMRQFPEGPLGPPVDPSSENDPEALTPPPGDQVPPVSPSTEGVTLKEAEEALKKPIRKRSPRKGPEKPQDAPGESSGPDQGGTALATIEAPQGILEPLSDEEAILRDQLEYDVEQGIEGAFKVAGALLTIREKRLYRSTHRTYEEYVEDKWEMSSRRARHLTFAAGVVKSLDEAGVTELPTNESQVRGLQGVVAEDHAKVWKKAQEDAKAKGLKEPGRKEVKEAAVKVGRPKGSKNAPKETATQKKVQKGKDNGAIPPTSEVTTTEVDEGVDAALVNDIDLPDIEWLAQFPIRDELNEHCRTLFEQEALFYRRFSPHRKPLVRNITSKLAAAVRQNAKRVGPYVSRIEKALSLADPRTWKVCRTCNGTGHVEKVGACNDCKTAGYRLG